MQLTRLLCYRKLITRMDGLVHDSLAIKPRLVPQMLQLSTLMGHLVDFGIRVCIHLTACWDQLTQFFFCFESFD